METALVEKVFDNYQLLLKTELERYAASNAAYENVSINFDESWIERRFGSELGATTGYDYALMIGRNGRVVFQHSPDPEAQKFEDLAELQSIARTFLGIHAEYSSIKKSEPDLRTTFAPFFEKLSAVEIIEIGEEVAIATSFAIVPDPGGIELSKEPPYVLVTLNLLNSANLGRLLDLLPLSDLQFGKTIPGGKNGVAVAIDTGEVVGYLNWSPVNQSRSIIHARTLFVIFASVALFVATLASFFFLNRLTSSQKPPSV
ncbi:CHASE4 domain-containing protein [Shimia sp. NS0008-38b]|uniref:CHASE4 domain-containing protein n=1 Tax=Shimia sp. NS0008-38b TaxID=3127653 RepID=UPI00333FE24E